MTQSLSARLKQPGLISAPGVFEMISARIADTMGFDALYMTGYGVVASHLGLPDAGLASYTEMVGRVHQIASGTSTPLIADGDTGYGGLLNVDHTVRGYEKAGAQAIQIEDQEYPEEMRPHARPAGGADRRRRAPHQGRGRSAFVEGFPRHRPHRCPHCARPRRGAAPRRSLSQSRRRHAVHRIAGERSGTGEDRPNLRRRAAGRQHGGRRPHADTLARGTGSLRASSSRFSPPPDFWPGAALRSVYGEIRPTGSSKAWSGELYPFDDFSRLMGFERVWAFEREHIEG